MVGIAVLAALVLGAVAIVVFADLAGGSTWPLLGANPPSIDSSRWFDVTRSAIAVVGLAGLGGGAIIAYRKQQTAERRQIVEEARQKTEAARQATEEARSSLERDRHQFEIEKRQDSDIADLRARYAKAAEQLGHAKAAVRLAGVYAMAALADDWLRTGVSAQQRVCVDVLCAYLRMPYDPAGADAGEKEVRMAIFGVIRDRMHEPDSHASWSRLPLDFTGAVIDGGSLAGVAIQAPVLFDGATFMGDFKLDGAKFSESRVSFRDAEFLNGTVSFKEASVAGGKLLFPSAKFSGGHLSFSAAKLSAGLLDFASVQMLEGSIDFTSMVMSGGEISMGWPHFVDGLITFTKTEFKGGRCHISGSRFHGGAIRFSQANFVGTEVGLTGVKAAKNSTFQLDFSAPRLWKIPPKVPGTPPGGGAENGSILTWSPDADHSGPAPWVVPQAWPPPEKEFPF